MTDYQYPEGDATSLSLGLLGEECHANFVTLLNQQMDNMLLLDLVVKSSSHFLCFSLLMHLAVTVTLRTKLPLVVNATPELNHEQDM
jgi:hypothetical protein